MAGPIARAIPMSIRIQGGGFAAEVQGALTWHWNNHLTPIAGSATQ